MGVKCNTNYPILAVIFYFLFVCMCVCLCVSVFVYTVYVCNVYLVLLNDINVHISLLYIHGHVHHGIILFSDSQHCRRNRKTPMNSKPRTQS